MSNSEFMQISNTHNMSYTVTGTIMICQEKEESKQDMNVL